MRIKTNQIAAGIFLLFSLLTDNAFANPTGLTVQSGSASVTVNGNQFNITASQNAFLNWQSFNIGAGETTTFIQPSAQSIVWNQIHDANPSQIYGNLNANGVVVLMNHSGFYFGPNSFVNAAGLVVSTASLVPAESSAGMFWQFNGPPPQASIVNYGQLNVGRGGSAFLIAENIENHGSITAPGGSIGLFAGQNVLLSERPDGLGLSAQVTLPGGSVDNFGRLAADGGTIAVNAQVVNQNGLIQANSVREKNGVIELLASDSLTLGVNSDIEAHGDDSGVSAGGKITIKSGNTLSDAAGSFISVAGGASGGNGGFVELSADSMDGIHSTVDGHAADGSAGGQLLIDPNNITIGFSGTGSEGSGTVGSDDAPTTGTLSLNVNSAFTGFSQIDLQAKNNITISGGTVWDLVASTGISAPGSLLKLEAGNNITIGSSSSAASIVAGEGWSVTLEAGRNFSGAADAVTSGTGTISLAGGSSLEAQDGNINLLAGNNITVGSGFVHTLNGGSITANAVGGSINTGTRANGFLFYDGFYAADPALGGISTANGGDVNLTAGLDVTSYMPVAGDNQTDAGSGAFGAAPGNVTITAGRDVSGHFVVMNGTGTINAGRNAGTVAKAIALSLADGGWTANAVNNIILQEVRNPNGIFNRVGFGSSTSKHHFDYAPDAYVTLNGGNSVQLTGAALPRYDDIFEQGITPIYPGTLTINAGPGGVILGNNVTLFPSPLGNLLVTTTGGGSLQTKAYADYLQAVANGNPPAAPPADQWQMIVSDSGQTQYKNAGDFGIADHATVPIHLDDPDPIRLDISGGMNGIILGAPKSAEINVVGDMVNSRLDGQNLHDDDVTSINVGQTAKENLEDRGVLNPATDGSLYVGGNILNRNDFTTVVVATPPDFSVFDLVYPPLNSSLAGLANIFFYNATTHELTLQGHMTGDQLDALLNLRVRTFDANGFPILDATRQPVTAPAKFVSAAVLNQLYAASQDVPLNPETGYVLGGGGTFNINANNLDLGSTVGIVSQGPRGNSALAKYFTHGADINVNLAGNLDMFSTKIASLNGGDININVGGYASIGSRTFLTSDQSARGIFTTDLSDVSVIAGGDIDVNGSRIAAYDGGNVTVRSLHGDIDAGTGISGAATVEKIYVNPATHRIYTYAPTIPGSGILATTFPPSLDPRFPRSRNTVGDILVETPEGSIIASAGGIVQIPLNGVSGNNGTVTLRAGSRDANGSVLYIGNIDASGSGVIGSNVKLEATGDIKGLVFARGNLDITAQQNVNVTALAVGNANVSAGDEVSGTIIGVGSVNVSGASVDAALLSQNVTASGDVTSSQLGFAQANAAGSTSQSLQNDDTAKTVAATDKDTDDDQKKKGKTIALAQKVGRVTVLLPTKNN